MRRATFDVKAINGKYRYKYNCKYCSYFGKDSGRSLYTRDQHYHIVDSNDAAVTRTGQKAGETRTSTAYAVEGMIRFDNTIDKYKPLTKIGNASNTTTTQWKQLKYLTGVELECYDLWRRKAHEADINQDLEEMAIFV